MFLVAKVATQLDRIGHASSFATDCYHTLPGGDRQPPSFPLFSCNADNNDIELDPMTDHPPSPMETVHHTFLPGGYPKASSNKVKRAHDIIHMRLQQRLLGEEDDRQHRDPRHQQQQMQQQQMQAQQHYPDEQHQPRPYYPTAIESKYSGEDDTAPFDEHTLNQPLIEFGIELGMGEINLEDTFGFDKNTKSDDDLFEKIYAGSEDEEGTLQCSSVELNPYPPTDCDSQRKWINEDNLNHSQGKKNAQQGVDSIFRSHRTTDVTKANNMQLVSPTVAMDLRLLSRPRAQAQQSAVVSMNSFPTPVPSSRHPYTGETLGRVNRAASTPRSSYRSKSRSKSRSNRSPRTADSLQRTDSVTSLGRNHLDLAASPTSPTRNRTKSRSRRSSSRGTSCRRRSRSRSTSIAPPKDDYHANLFRGAALIRDQLLRSMASADEAMDEADREFMEEMIEMGGRHEGRAGGGSQSNNNPSSPCRNSFARSTADSSVFEAESRRLDNIMGILTTNFATISRIEQCALSGTSLDMENNVYAHPEVDDHVTAEATCVQLQNSSLNLINATTAQIKPQPQNVAKSLVTNNTHSTNDAHYFQGDALRNIGAMNSPEETISNSAKFNSAFKEQSRPQSQTSAVDEAFAHAEKAGPFWRSLVGNHVRFPSKWDGLLPPTSPEIHSYNHKWSKWFYVARHRVKGDKRLNSAEFGVHTRRSGGRILMRMIIRGMQSQQVCREIAIGCFHPNSRGIRKGGPTLEDEDVREVWMAVRWLMSMDDAEPRLELRTDALNHESVVDKFLMQKKQSLDSATMGSTLGPRKAVNNGNVRAIFGDQPPISTVDLHEDEFAEILTANLGKKLAVLPALMLLKLFLLTK